MADLRELEDYDDSLEEGEEGEEGNDREGVLPPWCRRKEAKWQSGEVRI